MEKKIFLETLLPHMQKSSDLEATFLMQRSMQLLGKGIVNLSSVQELKNTMAFAHAFAFLNDNPSIKEVPTVEINGVVLDWLPKRPIIETKLQTLLSGETR